MRYATHALDAEGWTEWVYPRRGIYLMQCCDCGLVHRFKFRVHATTRKDRNGNFKVISRNAPGRVAFKAARLKGKT